MMYFHLPRCPNALFIATSLHRCIASSLSLMTPIIPRMPIAPHGFAARSAALKQELLVQGQRVQTQVELAFASLFDRKAETSKQAIAADDAIDEADVRLEKDAVALLTDATRQSANSSTLSERDLREVLTIVKVNNELERIADVAVDIAELVPTVEKMAVPFPDTFRVLANSVVGILRDVNHAMAKNDAKLANIVLQSQHAVWAFKGALVKESQIKVAKTQLTVEFAFQLHEVAHLCEVIADHCTNIAEQVIYLNTGKIVRHLDSAWVEVSDNKS